MAIIEKKGWNALKAAQKPKIPDKVSSVSVGAALDKYHAAAKKGGAINAIKELTALTTACATYKADLKKKFPNFVKVFETNIEDPVVKEGHQLAEMAHAPARMKSAINALITSLTDLAHNPDRASYMKVAGDFQALKSGLGEIYTMDKANNDWAPKYTTALTKAFDRDTGAAQPQDYKTAAAQTGQVMAMLIAELKKRHLYS